MGIRKFLPRRLTVAVVAAAAALLAPTVAAPAQAHHVYEDVSTVWYPWDDPGRADVLKANKTAFKQVLDGDPYVWGGSGPSSFDCSGLVYYAYHNAGAAFTRYTAKDLYLNASWPNHTTGRRVGIWEIRPGDLIFYSSNGAPSGINHVAIYLGRNRDNNKLEQVEALNPTSGLRITAYRTSGALGEVVRVFG